MGAIDQKLFPNHTAWMFMVLILDTRLRISEVIGLGKDQIDFSAGVLRVLGKGGKEREVPFGTTSKQALLNYTARRGEVPDQSLFLYQASRTGLDGN